MRKVKAFIGILVGLKLDGRARFLRTVTLFSVLLLTWLALGSVMMPSLIRYLGRMDIRLDGIFRAVPLGDTTSLAVIPVTIVDIDEASWDAWQRPLATPRDELVKMVQRAVHAGAAAVVVDIDVSGRWDPDRQGPDAFRAYLDQYPASFPPLILPRRLVDGPGGVVPAPSSYDGIVGVRQNLAWADATLESDDDGIIRRWSLWREVCSTSGTIILPAVLARLSAMVAVAPGARALPSLAPPGLKGSCRDTARDFQPRILLKRLPGRKSLTGSGMTLSGDRIAAVPARLVVSDEVARDDAMLFRDRIVFVGASHTASRDFHRTAYGELPGVEILAQQVHLAPLANLTSASGRDFRTGVSLLFFLLVVIDLFLKRGRAIAQAALLMVAGWFGVGILQNLSTYEVIANAVVLMIALVGLRAVGKLVEDWTRSRQEETRSAFLLERRPWRKEP